MPVRTQRSPLSSSKVVRGRLHVVSGKKKGFGTSSPTAQKNKGKSSSPKQGTTKEVLRPQEPPRSPPPADFATQETNLSLLSPPSTADGIDEDFGSRLQALKAEAKTKAASKKSEKAGSAPDFTGNPSTLYVNPPTVTDTILDRMNQDISDPALRTADIGPGRVGIAAGALVLVAVVALTSVGMFDGGKRYKGLRPARPPPDELGQAMLNTRITQLEEKLQATPEDDQALLALSATYGDMYRWDDASATLDRYLKLRPQDAESWRTYGDINLLGQNSRRAVTGYQQALALLPDNAAAFSGLVNAYIADTQYQKAIDLAAATRTRLAAAKAAGPSTAAAASTTTSPSPTDGASPAAGSSEPSESAATAASSSTSTSTSDSSSSSTSTSATPDAGTSMAEKLGGDAGAQTAPPLAAVAGTSSGSGSERPSLAGKGKAKRSVGKKRAAAELDPVEVELLAAKTYIAWRGHDSDALAAYDGAIKSFPEDYRLYQAKGLFLKERGRKADAERMFLQARYYAPSSMQQPLLEMQKLPSSSVDPNALPS